MTFQILIILDEDMFLGYKDGGSVSHNPYSSIQMKYNYSVFDFKTNQASGWCSVTRALNCNLKYGYSIDKFNSLKDGEITLQVNKYNKKVKL
jgi:hypothetical protein